MLDQRLASERDATATAQGTTMTEYTRREIRKLKPEIRSLIEGAAAKRDTQAFVKWLQKYGTHLSIERQAEIVAQFKQIVADESAKGRRRR